MWAVLVTATTFAAGGTLYAQTVASSGLTRLLVAAGPAATDVRVQASAPMEGFEARTTAIDTVLREGLSGTGPDILQTTSTTGSYALPGGGPTPDLTIFTAVTDLTRFTSLTAGALPRPGATPIQVVLTEPAARHRGLRIGDPLTVESRIEAGRAVDVRIVGLLQVPDPGDQRWADQRLLADGAVQGATFRMVGPLLVDRADLDRTGDQRVALDWSARPSLDRIAPDGIDPLRARLGALPERLADVLGTARGAEVRTDLPAVLARAERSLLVGDAGILLLQLQVAIIGIYALLLVAGQLREWRQAEAALLRARGAGVEHLVRITATEAVWLVTAALLTGPLLAWGALTAAAAAGWLGPGASVPASAATPTIAIVGTAAVLGLLGMILPTLAASGSLAAVRRSVGRQVGGFAVHRSGLDLAFVVVAGIALWQLRAYGGPLTTSVRGALGVDPLLVAAPAIGLSAGALLALRGIPWAARRLAAVADGRGGTSGWLATRQLVRRPSRFTAPALLLVVATGIGGFSVAYSATWSASQRDQVAHRLGAAAIVTMGPSGDAPGWLQAGSIGRLPGVTEAAPVVRSTVDLGGTGADGQTIAIDAERLGTMVQPRPDLAGASPEELGRSLIAARPEIELPAIPDGTTVLAIDMASALQAARSDGSPIDLPPEWPSARGVIVIQDGTGGLARFEGRGTRLDPAGRARLLVPLRDGDPAPTGPSAIVSVEIDLRTPPSIAVVGELAITGVAAVPDAWDAIAARADPALLTGLDAPVRISAGADPLDALVVAGDPRRFSIPLADPLDDPAGARFALRPSALSPSAGTAIPTLADPRLLDAAGVTIGETVRLGEPFRDPLPLEIVGGLALVPTTDPGRPAALLDGAAYGLVLLATRDEVPAPSEWWLAGDGLDTARLTAAAATDPVLSGATITVAADELDARLTDSVVQSVSGALLASALAALAFAAIGLAVSVTVDGRGRRNEFAVLRALGVAPAQLGRGLAIEAGFVVLCGVVAGIGVAGILAWVVLPSVGLTPDGSAPAPPPRIEWPGWLVIAAGLIGLGLWGALTAIAQRQVHPERTAATLREGAE